MSIRHADINNIWNFKALSNVSDAANQDHPRFEQSRGLYPAYGSPCLKRIHPESDVTTISIKEFCGPGDQPWDEKRGESKDL